MDRCFLLLCVAFCAADAKMTTWFNVMPNSNEYCIYVEDLVTGDASFVASLPYKGIAHVDLTLSSPFGMVVTMKAGNCPQVPAVEDLLIGLVKSTSLYASNVNTFGIGPSASGSPSWVAKRDWTNGEVTILSSTQSAIIWSVHAIGLDAACAIWTGSPSPDNDSTILQVNERGTGVSIDGGLSLAATRASIGDGTYSTSFWCPSLTAKWEGSVEGITCGGASTQFALVGMQGSLTYPPEVFVIEADQSCHHTAAPTTVAPTTAAPATDAPTTGAQTTVAPTTGVPTTGAPTPGAPITPAPPTTGAPTTAAPTTVAPTTAAPATAAPTTGAPTTSSGVATTTAMDMPIGSAFSVSVHSFLLALVLLIRLT